MRAAASLFCLLGAQARQLTLSGSLGWVEGPYNAMRPTVVNDDAAIEGFRVSFMFRADRSFLVRFG